MRNNAVKIFSAVIIVLIAAVWQIMPAAAAAYDTYTYWDDGSAQRKAAYCKPVYETEKVIGATDILLEEFTKLNDVCMDSQDNVYILDGESRIVVLDKYGNFKREIGSIGGTESYNDAEGIYVAADNSIYICDTIGKRIIHSSPDGELIGIIEQPESDLMPEDFNFTPTNITIDNEGYLFVLSDGSYYGALTYSPQGEFLGFFGANKVKNSIATVFQNIRERIFPNNEKRQNTARKLPYCFVDIVSDTDGFIYTSNGYTSGADGDKGQIRKLSPGKGGNILDSDDISFVDDRKSTTRYTSFYAEDLRNIAVDSDGFIYGLETEYGKVFVYDSSCRIINVFGGGMGEGTQAGTFANASGLAVSSNGDRIVVTDSLNNTITFFTLTEYGSLAREMLILTLDGKYEETKEGWQDIISQDSNFQPAYGGLARVSIAEEDYNTAMEYARTGYDREAYSLAFEYVRKDFLSRNFIWIFSGFIVLIAGAMWLVVVSSKRHVQIIKNRELQLMASTPFHPYNSFETIKEKKRGSLALCWILLLLFYVVNVSETLFGGFLFTVYDRSAFNSLIVLIRTAGIVLLWMVTNWLVCTLLGGNGKIREIAIVVCYSLLPVIAEKILRIVLTHVLIPSESGILNVLDVIAVLWFLLLMTVGLIRIHDFSFGRMVGTSVLSLAGIAAIVFLITLLILLAQQFYGFIATLLTEIMTI